MNIKGVFQIWMHDGAYHEVPLKECHAWTREGCKMCPDFAAEHADISTGGIGKYNDWTLTIVRTDAGRELMERMLTDGAIETRPGDDDPDAIALMHKLSKKSRKRWPEFADRRPAPDCRTRTAGRGIASARMGEATDAAPLRVLLVEDHAMVARGLEAALAEEPDLEVVGIAGTVEDGVLRFRQLQPDVVVMDYRLPDGQGTDATRQIRATEAEAAVLLLTGADDPSVVAAALDSGCSGFVSKDRDVDELASAIRAVARGAAVFPADLLSRALSPRRQVGTRIRPHLARTRSVGDARRRRLDRGDRERALPEPAHRAQPRSEHPHQAALAHEVGGRRRRGAFRSGRPASRRVRSLRVRVAVVVVAAFIPAFVVLYVISRNDRDEARDDTRRRDARARRPTLPTSTKTWSATRARCYARSARYRRTTSSSAGVRVSSPR